MVVGWFALLVEGRGETLADEVGALDVLTSLEELVKRSVDGFGLCKAEIKRGSLSLVAIPIP